MVQFSQKLKIEYKLHDKPFQKGFKERKIELHPDKLLIADTKPSRKVDGQQTFPLEYLRSVDRLSVKDIIIRLEFQESSTITINFSDEVLYLSLFLEKLIENWSNCKIPALKSAKAIYNEKLSIIDDRLTGTLDNIKKHDYSGAFLSLDEIVPVFTSFHPFLRSKELRSLILSVKSMLKSLEVSARVDASTRTISHSNSDDFLLIQHYLAAMDKELFEFSGERAIERRRRLFKIK
ncbi:MAG: hypothetical protein ACFFD4_39415 [Candidatus Odinarchaeota archaeon]